MRGKYWNGMTRRDQVLRVLDISPDLLDHARTLGVMHSQWITSGEQYFDDTQVHKPAQWLVTVSKVGEDLAAGLAGRGEPPVRFRAAPQGCRHRLTSELLGARPTDRDVKHQDFVAWWEPLANRRSKRH